MTLSRRLGLGCLIFLLACTVGCDQTSKHFAREQLRRNIPVTLAGGLAELRLADNPGSFLSLGAFLPVTARFAVFIVAVGLCLVALFAYLMGSAQICLARFAGLSFVLAGGTSNLLDRIFRRGLVTDFVILHIGPLHTGVFNVADVLILIGIGVIIFTFWKGAPPIYPTPRFDASRNDAPLTDR